MTQCLQTCLARCLAHSHYSTCVGSVSLRDLETGHLRSSWTPAVIYPDREGIVEEPTQREETQLGYCCCRGSSSHQRVTVTGQKSDCNLIVITIKIMLLLLNRQR